MLNEPTAAAADVSRPDKPAFPSLAQVLRQVAAFLDAVPSLPELYITVDERGHVGLQLPSYDALAPQDRFPAVARLAQAMGTDAHLSARSHGRWVFEADGTAGDLRVHVYAPFNDVQVVSASDALPTRERV
ncbi:hypothetical protein [Streptomyces sp. NPDC054837]